MKAVLDQTTLALGGATVQGAEQERLIATQASDDLKEQIDEAELTLPALGSDNAYDSGLSPGQQPDKKNIKNLLTGLFDSSPLVSMVRSFSISTSTSSGVVPIGMVYGQELSFDFTRWEVALRACGGVLIIIMQGYSILIVVRGW